MKRTHDGLNYLHTLLSSNLYTLMSSVQHGSINLLEFLLDNKSLQQDEIVVAYIEALELGNKDAVTLLKKHIKYYNEKTDFDFTVSETIAMYAFLLGKRVAYDALKKEVMSDFYLPITQVFLLAAARYGYVDMMKLSYDAIEVELSFEVKEIAKAAVQSGNIAALEWVVANLKNFDFYKAAMFKQALKCGNLEFAEYLRSKGVEVIADVVAGLNERDVSKRVCESIVKSGRIDVLQYMLSHQVSFDDDLNLCGAITRFADEKVFGMIDDLIPLKESYQALAHDAVEHNNINLLKYLLFSKDLNLNDILFKSILWGALDSIGCLVSYGIDIKKVLETSSHLYMNVKALSYLVIQGMDLNYVMSKVAFLNPHEKPCYGLLKCWSGDIEKRYTLKIIRALVVSNDLESIKHLLALGVDIKGYKDDLLGLGDINIVRYFFSLNENAESSVPESKYLLAAAYRGELEVLQYLHSKGGNADGGELIREAVLCESNIHIVRYVISKCQVRQLESVDIAEILRRLVDDRADYHVLACTDLGSLCAQQIDEYHNEKYVQAYKVYSEHIKKLSINVNPNVLNIAFNNISEVAELRKIRANFIEIFEMFYCAVDCPTEVLCLIASTMLGFEFDVNALCKYSYLTNIILPRESEGRMNYVCDTPSHCAEYMYLLYLHNQKPSITKEG